MADGSSSIPASDEEEHSSERPVPKNVSCASLVVPGNSRAHRLCVACPLERTHGAGSFGDHCLLPLPLVLGFCRIHVDFN